MKRLIAPLAAALLITLAGCSFDLRSEKEGGRSGSTSQSSSQTSSEPESAGPKNVAFGESVEVATDTSTQLRLTIGAPADFDAAQADFPPEQGKFVVVDARAALTEGFAGNVSEDEFTLIDANGNRYEPAIASIELSGSFLHLLTDEGVVETGRIIYDVPVDASGFKIEYAPTDVESTPLGLLATWE